MKIELIVFDFDGTIADTCHTIVATIQSTMRIMNLPVADIDTCKSTIGLPLKSCFAQIYPHLDDDVLDKCTATYCDIFNKNKELIPPSLFPNVKSTLHTFNDLGITLSVASSRSYGSLGELIEKLGIGNYISYVVGADNVAKAKPAPDPVLKTLQALNIKAENAIVVGDMPVDIMMGSSAHTLTCGITYGNSSRQQLAAKADYIIDDISQLLKLRVF